MSIASLIKEKKAVKKSKQKADELFRKMVLGKSKIVFKERYGRPFSINQYGDVSKMVKIQGQQSKKWKNFGTSKWKGK